MGKYTLVDFFDEKSKEFADKPFLKEKKNGEYQVMTYSEAHDLVLRYGAGWLSLGIKKGDKIALLCEGCNDWILGEMSMLYAGATNVPLSVKLTEAGDILFRINHSESRFVMVSQYQLEKIRKIKDKLGNIEKYIVVSFDDIIELEDDEILFGDLLKAGDSYEKEHPGKLLEVSQSVQNEDLANITYTSGTIADPKGVMLTHRNYTSNVEQIRDIVPFPKYTSTLVILPLDHCFAHVTGLYTFIDHGGLISTVPVGKTSMQTLRNIPLAIRDVRPNVIMTVPALARNLKNAVEKAVIEKGKNAMKIFNFAVSVAKAYNKEGYNRGTGFSVLLKPLVSFFDRFLFSSMRKSLGGELLFFIDGGAYLDVEMQKFWYATGIPMFQGYGLSEATPVISSSCREHHKLGTSGLPSPKIKVAIRDEDGRELPVGEKGEITIKGENVMAGYWKNKEATNAVIKDGWLYTGDLGTIDNDGYIDVYGRSKCLLIGNDGEKYSPEGIEEYITTISPYISQVMLYNNQNAYTVGLIVPDKSALERDISELNSDVGKKEAISKIKSAVDSFRKGGVNEGVFLERWLPTTFALLEDSFNEQNKMLNSTMKMVRSKIEKAYEERLKYLYTSEGKNVYNDSNMNVF